ncbi:MAG: hypothetical protein LBQ52_04020 [Helicobacteraceae bacterium]|jgi:hypothetical protein|nr:hypothetical protein [Helicobacteraceae bacterium]
MDQEINPVKKTSIKSKMVGYIFIIFLLTIQLLYPCSIKKAYLALINGQTIELEQYTVSIPFPEWFISKRETGAYTIMPDFNNKAFIIVDHDVVENPNNAPTECDFTSLAIKKYAQIEGRELDCKEGETKFLLFLSNDGYFLFLSIPDRDDQELMKKYELLLNSVKKKP